MAIEGTPKVSGPAPQVVNESPVQPATRGAGPTKTPATAPPAMEKPATLSQPEAAPTHPARQSREGRQPALEEEVARLRQALQRKGADRPALAHQALAMAGSFRLRRSRRGRRLALELCEEAGAAEAELQPLAGRLTRLLAAEGELHELTAEGTLRACLALVALCDEKTP